MVRLLVRRAVRGARRRPFSAVLVLLVVLVVLQAFLAGSSVGQDRWSPKRVLLLTAHPDDEVMFFGPVIAALVASGVEVFGLCLSEGNADGLGAIRRQELKGAYEVLGVPASRVTSLDDAALQDGMQAEWDAQYIARVVSEYAAKLSQPIDTLITFDAHGVSGHANHIALHRASLLLSHSSHLQIFNLRTLPLHLKYLGLLTALPQRALHLVFSRVGNKEKEREEGVLSFLASPREYVRTLDAMRRHASQLVWFRYAYVVASAHMYGSFLERVAA